MRALLLILDGLGDYPSEKLKGKTPLEASKAKNMLKMGIDGETGFLTTIGYGIPPGSDTAHLAILGYNPETTYAGRGVYEALGSGIKLKKGDVAFRVNFATVDSGIVKDRRAGRNGFGLDTISNEINGMKIDGVKIIFKHTTEHRAVLVLRGRGLSNRVSDTDPHIVGKPVKEPKPTDKTKEAKRTADILKTFLKEVNKILENHPINRKREKRGLLKANSLLVRGAGMIRRVRPFHKVYGVKGCAIAGGALYRGVADYIGLDVVTVPGATGDKNTDLNAKATAAIDSKQDFVFVHIKATDSFSHDRDPVGKRNFIKKVDTMFIKPIMKEFDLIFISGDHSTPCVLGRHTSDPVPLLIYGPGLTRRDAGSFSESGAGSGIYRIFGLDVVRIILSKIGKVGKYGE